MWHKTGHLLQYRPMGGKSPTRLHCLSHLLSLKSLACPPVVGPLHWLPVYSGYKMLLNGYKMLLNGYKMLLNGYKMLLNGYKMLLNGYKMLLNGYKMLLNGYKMLLNGYNMLLNGYKMLQTVLFLFAVAC